MNALRISRCCWPVLAVLIALGCAAEKKPGWQRPKVVHANGVVRYQGQPLEGALVTFTNEKQSTSAFGRTDAEGKFTLTTFKQGDGVVPGAQAVAVSKVQMPNQLIDKSAAPSWRKASTPAQPQPRWLIPKRYGNPATSQLSVDVSENGTSEIMLELHGSPTG
jgi:hypothetical protein